MNSDDDVRQKTGSTHGMEEFRDRIADVRMDLVDLGLGEWEEK